MIYLIKEALERATVRFKDNICTRKLRIRIGTLGIIIRFLIEACIEMGLVALIALIKLQSDRFSSFQDGLAIVLAVLALISLIFAPIYLLKLSKKYVNGQLKD